MFLRPRFFRGLAAAAVLGIGLAACHEDVTIPVTPTISANPQSITLDVGQSQRIVASLTGVDGGVSFESLNPTVASVTGDGLVTGLALGPATIRVYATNQPALQTGVAVTVSQTVIPPTDSARVMIQSVTTSQTINPVDPDSVVGNIDITMSVERGQADQLQLLVNNSIVTTCTQTFGATGAITVDGLSIGAAEQSVVCSLDTRAFDRVGNRGVPRYPNGPLVSTAKLLQGTATLDQAQTGEYTLWNSDRLDVEVASIIPGSSDPRPNVIGDGGLLWLGNGDLRFTVVPVIYSTDSETGSGYPAQVTIDFEGFVAGNDTDKASTQDELEDGGFVITFPKSSAASTGSANLNTGREGARLNVSSVTQGGQPGPATVYSPFSGNPTAANRVRFFTSLQSGTALLNAILRFDNEAPQAGRLILPAHPQVNRVWARNGWVNDQVNFFTAKDGSHDSPFEYGGSIPAAYTGSAPGSAYTNVYGSIPSLSSYDPIYGVGQDSTVIYASLGSDTLRLGARAGNTGGTASSATLTPTLTNSEWSVWARVWDKLGNVSTVQIDRNDPVVAAVPNSTEQTGTPNRIGVDLVAPEVSIQLSDTLMTRYNPIDETVSVQGIDGSVDPAQGPSGIALTQLQLQSYACPATVLECQPAPATNETVTPLVTPGPATTGNAITEAIGAVVGVFPRDVNDVTSNRYHNYRGQIFDRAGNASEQPTSMQFIRDTTTPFPPIDSILPLVSNVNIPPVLQFMGGTAYPFAATVSDNVDLRKATSGFDFDGDFRVPFVNIPITSWGPDHIVTSKLLTQEMPYIRSLSSMTGPATVTPAVLPTRVRFVAFDHSSPLGAFSAQVNNLVPNTRDTLFVPWLDTDPAPNSGIMISEVDSLTWLVGGATGTFQNPFSQVLFYVQLDDLDDGSTRDLNYLIGPAGPPQIQDGYLTIYRVYRFTSPPIPQEVIDWGGDYTVFAIGISPAGDALSSQAGYSTLP